METRVPTIVMDEKKGPTEVKSVTKYPPKLKRKGRDVCEAYPNEYRRLENGVIIKLGRR